MQYAWNPAIVKLNVLREGERVKRIPGPGHFHQKSTFLTFNSMNIRSPKPFSIVLVLLAILAVEAFAQTGSPLTPFQGRWSFTFSGTLKGTGTMDVGTNGKILVYVSLGKYDRLFSNPISLNVNESGTLDGNILLWHLPVGGVEGKFTATGEVFGRVSTPFFNVGSVLGKMESKTASGSYKSVAGDGNWSAVKN